MQHNKETYPLVPLQQGMLYDTLLKGNGDADILQIVCRLKENADPGVFKKAWRLLIDQHPAPRISCQWGEGKDPCQVIHENVELDWFERDWRDRSPEHNESALEDFLAKDLTREFDLAKPPLMRIAWIAMAEADHCMIWTFHHLLLDGRSLTLLLEDLFALARQIASNASVEVPHRPDYRDHLKWFQKRDFSFAESWWKKKLEGITEATLLRVEKNSHSANSARFDFAERKIELEHSVLQELTDYASARGVTLNTLIQGAWAVLLSVYSGKEDVVFGTVRAGRRSSVPGAEQMIGVFINTVPVRVNVPRDAGLDSWLKALRARHLEVRDYEHTPLFRIQQWSEVRHGNPLLWSLVAFERYDLPERLRESGEEGRNRSIEIRRNTTFPLTLAVKASKHLDIRIQYHHKYYTDETVESILRHFKNLLTGFLDHKAGATLAGLPVFDESERWRILEEWNDTRAAYRTGVCVQELFEEQTARTPDAPAVIFGDEQLSYDELNRRANQLAHWLRQQGVGPDVRVGLVMERSVEMVVGIYGTLKAGGAYVPLEPDQPQARLKQMAEDAELKALLTQQKFSHLVAGLPGRKLLLDCQWDEVDRQSKEDPGRLADEHNLAYVIYTSGSTGKPKGVMIEHAAIVNRLFWMQEAFKLDETDRILQKTPYSFDVSVWEFFWPLLNGAALVIAGPHAHQDPGELRRLIERQRVTTIHFVPSMLRVFLDQPELSRTRGLRRVICSGEALSLALMNDFFARMPAGVELHNLYGPTEAAVDVTHWPCRPDPEWKRVPIGKPIANTQTYIVDQHLQPVPVGVAGELLLGGVQLARGYLNRPEFTAETFIANPFPHAPSPRLYRTGDLARYRPDGNIEYLGRLDHQVKIRGQRIELGEIESTLQQLAPIQEAVVQDVTAANGERQLAAFYTVRSGAEPPAPAGLRDHLKERLPDSMIPAHFVALERLPLTPNGKVDRKVLEVPEAGGLAQSAEFAPPRGKLEKQLAEIWSELLGVRRVGIRDDFFDLGGHSLMAVKLFSRLQKLTGKDLPLATLFQASTIEQLAKILSEENKSPDWSLLVPMKDSGSRPPFFCLHDIGGNVLVYQHFNKYIDSEQPFYGIQAQGLDGQEPRHHTLEAMAACYITEMRKVQPRGPYYLGGHCFGGILAYEVARQLASQGETIGLLAMLDAYPPVHTARPSNNGQSDFENSKPISRETKNAVSAGAGLRRIIPRTLDFGKRMIWRAKRRMIRLYLPNRLLVVEKNCHHAWWKYYPKPFAGKITLFQARESLPGTAAEKMARWRPYAQGGLEVVEIPVTHSAMMREPGVRKLVAELNRRLQAAHARFEPKRTPVSGNGPLLESKPETPVPSKRPRETELAAREK